MLVHCFLYLTFLAFERKGCVNAWVNTQFSSFLLGFYFCLDGKIDSLGNVILKSFLFDYVSNSQTYPTFCGKKFNKKCLVVL